MRSFLIYLFQVSVCHTAFYMLYRYFFQKHTFFQSNRIYLLFTTLFSFIIPILNIGIWSSGSIENLMLYPIFSFSESQLSNNPDVAVAQHVKTDLFSILEIALSIIYFIGVSIFVFKLFHSIRKIKVLINGNRSTDHEGYKIVKINKGPSFFSFMSFVFINDAQFNVTHEELAYVLSHEKVHIRQRHSIDILFMELVSAICWFNPVVKKMKSALSQIHEFIADDKVISNTHAVDNYSRLILRLSSKSNPIPLTHQFSMINIKNRIIMLNQTKNNKMKNVKLFLALPLALILMTFFSFTERTIGTSTNVSTEKSTNSERIFGEISWEGNTKFSDAMLNKILDIKKGDVYSQKLIQEKLSYSPHRDDIGSLYLDNGHLFFNITPEEEIVGNVVNLNFKIYEGMSADFDNIIIKGNHKIKKSKVLEMIDFIGGEPFNRSKLVQSQKNIAESGFFKNDEVGINPIPKRHGKKVDIEFVLIEL